MAGRSSIEWTEATWNPVTGCTKISPGCKHCYAERLAKRLKAMGAIRYRNGFEITLHPDLLNVPLKWKKPRLVFVNSMSDLFHESVPLEFIQEVFAVMNKAHWHTFQILTKRSVRLRRLSQKLTWTKNIWMGVSVESEKYCGRIEDLKTVPSSVRFLSIEPLLSEIPELNLAGLQWVIVGGESGPGARPMLPQWVRRVRSECRRQRVPFFFKQWGGVRKDLSGRVLDGRTYDELPILQ